MSCEEEHFESAVIRRLRENRRGLFACVYIGFVFYASLLPFDFHWGTGWSNLSRTREMLRSHAVASGRSDIVANVLFYVPLGAAVCLTVRHRFRRWAPGVVAGLLGGVATSGTVEFLQLFSASRVGSPVDVVTNSIGTFLGCAVSPLALLVLRHWREQRRRAMATQPVWHLARLAAAATLLCAMVPFDVRTDLGEIRAGLGAACVRPFQQLQGAGAGPAVADFWVDFAGDAGAFALLAGLVALAAAGEARVGVITAVVIACWTGVLVSVVGEVAQIFIASRGFDTTDIIAAACGALPGAVFGAALGRIAAWRRWTWGGPVNLLGLPALVLILIADAAYLTARGLGPFSFHAMPPGTQWLSAIEWVPFRSYTANLTPALVGEFVLKGVRYVVFAMPLALLLSRLPGRYGREFAARTAVVVACAVVLSAAIEVAQLATASRYSDISDVLIAAMGAAVGATGVEWYQEAVRHARHHLRRRAAAGSREEHASAAVPG